jgi:hypothetical protein
MEARPPYAPANRLLADRARDPDRFWFGREAYGSPSGPLGWGDLD